ncbi:MAG: OmpA family protein [Usitatibacter sp.]
MKTRLLPIAALVIAALAGCATAPLNSQLAQARADYSAAQSNPQVTSLAAGELREAGNSLDSANAAAAKDEKEAVVNHLAYVASQKVAIARETASQKAAEQAIAAGAVERDRVRLEARTREAENAQRNANIAQRSAEVSQMNAAAAQRQSAMSRAESQASQRDAEAAQRQSAMSRAESEASQRDAEAAMRQAQMEKQAATDAQVNAAAARQQAMDAEGRARALEAQLRDLEAKKTDRGMVVTLGDVLFDTNRAELKPGGMRSIQKLADFFKQYPQRTVVVEGFTDSVGSQGTNQALSDNRAAAVRTALLNMGVPTDRVSARGYGEAYPVASNDNATGRQLNRRVEIVVSDDNGRVPPRS